MGAFWVGGDGSVEGEVVFGYGFQVLVGEIHSLGWEGGLHHPIMSGYHWQQIKVEGERGGIYSG
jgi:hypothetical protein